MNVAVYVRTSTANQNLENQLLELRAYAATRGWKAVEYADQISGATEKRGGLDALLKDARRRKFSTVVVWSLDRLGRSLPHLVSLLAEFDSLGITFVSLREGLDMSTAAGRLQAHVLGALAAFERERLRERVLCGLARARAEGKRLGRQPHELTESQLASVRDLSVRDAAKKLGVSYSVVSRRRAALLRKPGSEPGIVGAKTGAISTGSEGAVSVA